VLELAGGTGFWTRRLAESARELTVVDASPETLELNRQRVGRSDVEYITADLFRWSPVVQYDVVAFTFWLSHVPPELFTSFWDLVERCLAPGGKVFFIDSKGPESTTSDRYQLRPDDISVSRELNDGRTFRIYKLFYSPQELQQRLDAMGWRAAVATTTNFFLYGRAERK
jgi:demethylmenaquinone methyltransferase/2-methoxy-6-polyprenyl-1,4-benzoquinol methylase